MVGTPIDTLSASQIRDELSRLYNIKEPLDQLELNDLRSKLADARKSQLITYGLKYGPLLCIGNTKNPTAVVTLSHGLGDSAHGWEDVGRDLARRLPQLLFLLPTAPVRPVTINGGFAMNAWYDIKDLLSESTTARQDVEAVMMSADYLKSLAYTTAQRYRISANRVVYAGFSQGAAVSLAAGLTSFIAPAGIAVLSGYLAGSSGVLPQLRNKTMPILMCHGKYDQVVPFAAAQQTKSVLEAAGVTSITLKSYPMEHSSHPDELNDFVNLLNSVLPPVQA